MAGQRWWSTSELCQSALSKAERDFAYPRMDIQMKALTSMIATLMILIGAKALAANLTCQDTDLKKRVAYYAANLPGGYYAKWNEVSCATSPGSEALVFSIRHVVSEQHDDGRLFMTIGRVERIVVDGNGNIDPSREAQWSQYKDGPIDQAQ